jgi:Family of unknown function (DUF6152)
MKTLAIGIITATTGVLFSASSNAHHSFAAEFDRDLSVEFTGVVTAVEWTNPHSRFYVDAPDPDMDGDEIVNWNIEMVSANVLMRQGWRHDTLKVGDVVTVTAARARKNPHVVNGSTVVRDTGERLFARTPGQVNQ